ncbi:uncharacterized protein Gasu_61920 [Galdieria sulphuraria]|uniref:Uncharacterized protein n=1 Tax=Galdieria sulphuraria TaxID=130081 RepID=M2X8I7_GALSU|nr:uncharacterized protein Gasu_61920 [Galdieria sulphuraria]EME26162.1 hypothetical protein Gasu_61920 [Galdieria sulphuraria]|eukprot:XP_005702682.1 hypothetical protein Gasu_61920 [Galdieria sulphuraria]
MGKSGEIAMGENEWGKGVRKLEKRGQPKGDCVDLKIAIMDAGKNGTVCELKILGESIHQEECLKNSNSKSKRLKFELQLYFMR